MTVLLPLSPCARLGLKTPASDTGRMDASKFRCPHGHAPLYRRDSSTIVCPTCTRDPDRRDFYSETTVLTEGELRCAYDPDDVDLGDDQRALLEHDGEADLIPEDA